MDSDVTQDESPLVAVEPGESESMELMRSAVSNLEEVIRGIKQKYQAQLSASGATADGLRNELAAAKAENEKLIKRREDARFTNAGLRREIEVLQADQKRDGGVVLEKQNALLTLRQQYDALHNIYTRSVADRSKDRAGFKIVFDKQKQQMLRYGQQIRALGGIPDRGASGLYDAEGLASGSNKRARREDSMRQRSEERASADAVVKLDPSSSTPIKRPPSDVRECFTARKPLCEVVNSRDNTPTKRKRASGSGKEVRGVGADGEDSQVMSRLEVVARERVKDGDDVFGGNSKVLVEESLEKDHPVPPARARGLSVFHNKSTHTPVLRKSFAAPSTDRPHRTPGDQPVQAHAANTDPPRAHAWMGGNKSKQRTLRRRDSFENEHAGGGTVGLSGPSGSGSGRAFGTIGVRKEIKLREVILGPANIPTDLREMQGMDVGNDETARYEINPERNGGLPFAYGEVVRNKEHRKHLPGDDCDECRGYYDGVRDIPIVDIAPLWRSPKAADEVQDRQRHMNEVSRHRSKHAPNSTPPGYWQIAFPDTQQVGGWNALADQQKASKRAKMRSEAEKPDGLYRAVQKE